MTATNNLKLPDGVSSMQELQALTVELRGFAKWFAHVAIKQRAGVKLAEQGEGTHPNQPTLSPAAVELITNWQANQAADKTAREGVSEQAQQALSQEDLDKLLAALADHIDSAPQVTITLAAPASGELRRSLVVWCRANLNPGVLVSFRFNSTLLGGMVVRYGSHIYDWSFRRAILANRNAFPEILRHV